MKITIETLMAVAGATTRPEYESNMVAVVAGLDLLGAQLGLDKPHRLAHYIAQIAHENGRFRYDRELWDGKRAQARYDTRADLGNTPEKDGDGKLYRGRTGIQITGRANYASFRDWCRSQGLEAPDFVISPDLTVTDPWEGLGPIWYWSTRGLNRYADENNVEMITRRINGGMNGFDDRVSLYVRAALVLLGYDFKPGTIRAFQTAQGLVPDDIAGPKTRDTLHEALVAMDAPHLLTLATPAASATPAPPVVTGEILPPAPIAGSPRPDLIGRPSAVVERILRDEGSRTIQKANQVITKAVTNQIATVGPAGFIVSLFAFVNGIPTWAWIVGGIALAATLLILFLSTRQSSEAKAIKIARVDDAVTGNIAFGGPAKAMSDKA